MNLLTTSIDSIRLARKFRTGALTLLGVFAIALALILPFHYSIAGPGDSSVPAISKVRHTAFVNFACG
jgi:hypothetical protein